MATAKVLHPPTTELWTPGAGARALARGASGAGALGDRLSVGCDALPLRGKALLDSRSEALVVLAELGFSGDKLS
jgi:hypothetical protein